MTQTSNYKTTILWAVVVSALFMGGVVLISNNGCSSEAMPSEWTQCSSDADCTPVGTECCDAQYTQAINAQFLEAWKANHPKQSCAPTTACIMMVPLARCENGACTVRSTQPVSK